MTWRAFFSSMADDVAAALDNGQPLPEAAAFQLYEALERDRPGFGIIRHADGWRVTFEGETRHIPDCKGMAEYALLLTNPDHPVSVPELWSLCYVDSPREEYEDDHPECLSQPINDDKAVAVYKALLVQNQEEMDRCETVERLQELQAEREAVEEALNGPLYFQDNRVNTMKERLRSAHKLIAKHHPDAGAYLNGRVTRDGFEHTYSGVRFLSR